jgi:hypothetical protein
VAATLAPGDLVVAYGKRVSLAPGARRPQLECPPVESRE